MTKDETLELALNTLANARDFISYVEEGYYPWDLLDQLIECQDAIKAIKAALEAKDEPVAWEAIEKVAQKRYKVVPSDTSMFYRFAVVAGDGNQQLFIGRYTECQVMAKKFTGAFLDGAFLLEQMTNPPQQEAKDEPVAWDGYNLDDMCEAFNRVIEEHFHRKHPFHDPVNNDAMIALRTLRGFIPYMKRHTTPPQRTWVGLTDEERKEIHDEWRHKVCSTAWGYEQAIEAKLKEKNT